MAGAPWCLHEGRREAASPSGSGRAKRRHNSDAVAVFSTLHAEGVQLAVSERVAFVARAGSDDPAVHRELSELLQVEEARLQDFLGKPAVAVPDALKRGL